MLKYKPMKSTIPQIDTINVKSRYLLSWKQGKSIDIANTQMEMGALIYSDLI